MEGRVGVAAVLRKADGHVRILPVEIVKEAVVVSEFSHVPAEVNVVRDGVRHVDQGIRDVQHHDICHDRGARGVHRFHEAVELVVVLTEIVRNAAHGDLV